MKLKICGITNKKDAEDAVNLGVDALGFIFYEQSPRNVSIETVHQIVSSIPPFVTTVGVFVNKSTQEVNDIVNNCKLDIAQLHGKETPQECMAINSRVIKTVHVNSIEDIKYIGKYNGTVSGVLLDTKVKGSYGGTGQSFDWGVALAAKDYEIPIILSGGVSIQNISQAVELVSPDAIDICSSVEKSPGLKDYEKMREIISYTRSL